MVSRSWWVGRRHFGFDWDDWVKLMNFMRWRVRHSLQAWRYIIQTSEHCRERMLWTQWLLRGGSHETSWLERLN